MSAALARDAFLPRSADSRGLGAALAVLVHVLLVVALAFGVEWRSRAPEGVTAELWSALPQVAAPRSMPLPAAEPAPAPARAEPRPEPALRPEPVRRIEPAPRVEPAPVARPDPRIAVERAARERRLREAEEAAERRADAASQAAALARRQAVRKADAERERRTVARERTAERDAQRAAERARDAEHERQRAAAERAEKKKQDDDERRREARLATQHEANLRRAMAQAGTSDDAHSIGSAARDAGPSAGYAGRIKARIKPNVVLAGEVAGNPLAVVEVRLAPDGTIVGRKLLQSSVSAAWDQAVLRAIDKTETLPRDTDGRVPASMTIEFRPRE